MAELIIRIKALLNKITVRKEEKSTFSLGQYTFDSITQTLQYCGEKQLLSNRESEILKRLCENKDHVLPMKDSYSTFGATTLSLMPAAFMFSLQSCVINYRTIPV